MAASVVLRLQTIVSREVAAADAAVLTVGVLQAGTKENVIPDDAVIKAVCRRGNRPRAASDGACGTNHDVLTKYDLRGHRCLISASQARSSRISVSTRCMIPPTWKSLT